MGEQVLAGLMANPQFAQVRALIRENPDSLPIILQQISANSPQLYELISKNPETFERLIMEDNPSNLGAGMVPPSPPPGSIVVTK